LYGPYKAQADAWAHYYAGKYRGGFMLNHLLSWFAVLFASLGLLVLSIAPEHKNLVGFGILLAVAELAAIAAILRNVWRSRREHWHEKSISYRYLAELLRQMDFLAPLGCATPSSRPPVQYAGNDPRQTWMTWLFRAIVRAAPPVITRDGLWRRKTFTDAHCQAALTAVRKEWLRDQVQHHRGNSRRMGGIHSTIEFWSKVFFYFVLACVSIHFVLDLLALTSHAHPNHTFLACCIVFAIILPAAVITLIGFRNQAEARRLKERSWNMALQLVRFSRDLRCLQQSPRRASASRSWETAAGIAAFGQVMIDEVTDWQIVYRMHEISEA